MKIALKVLSAGFAAFFLSACSDEPTALRVLQAAGYTDIVLDGYAWSGCGKEDHYATAFKARGPSGVHVEGVVCSGVFKGATIRIY